MNKLNGRSTLEMLAIAENMVLPSWEMRRFQLKNTINIYYIVLGFLPYNGNLGFPPCGHPACQVNLLYIIVGNDVPIFN